MAPILPENLVIGKRYHVLKNNIITKIALPFIKFDGHYAIFININGSYGFYQIEGTHFFNEDDPDIPVWERAHVRPAQVRPAQVPALQVLAAQGWHPLGSPQPSLLSAESKPWSPPPPASPWERTPEGEPLWKRPPPSLPQGAPAALGLPLNDNTELIRNAMTAYRNPGGGRRSYFRLKKRKTKSRKTKTSKKTIKRRR